MSYLWPWYVSCWRGTTPSPPLWSTSEASTLSIRTRAMKCLAFCHLQQSVETQVNERNISLGHGRNKIANFFRAKKTSAAEYTPRGYFTEAPRQSRSCEVLMCISSEERNTILRAQIQSLWKFPKCFSSLMQFFLKPMSQAEPSKDSTWRTSCC